MVGIGSGPEPARGFVAGISRQKPRQKAPKRGRGYRGSCACPKTLVARSPPRQSYNRTRTTTKPSGSLFVWQNFAERNQPLEMNAHFCPPGFRRTSKSHSQRQFSAKSLSARATRAPLTLAESLIHGGFLPPLLPPVLSILPSILPPLLSILPSILSTFDAPLVAGAAGEKRASRRGYQSEQEQPCGSLIRDRGEGVFHTT
jgi:hypothetical protein